MATSAKVETATFTVARGRSVIIDDGVGRNGKPKFAEKVGGEKVILPVTDGERLRGLGFLQEEDGSVSVRTDGPATSAGDEIKEKA